MFLGEFEHTIDEKNRITIPAKFRGKLAAGMVITKGIDNCLWLYPIDSWDILAQKIATLRLTDPSAREFVRQVFGGAVDAVPDRQGRVNMPTYLREYASIERQAVIVGLYDHCEIWNADHWRERQARSHQDPEGRAALFESLGI
jgi:MraZ protein